ncbi:DUF7373 family lipoprotein [Nocardia arthritidis]|uniref:Uncharacterized protein n=1 Tax=Nocardia arthritidis TaxID=228602 RepID=A0A6G9YSW0_9NOCA|nr:hypothetical protein [Nocardia arthritidis]QIS15973.1 hypothetical protein F5544_40785 [Nocardia arthritidis]
MNWKRRIPPILAVVMTGIVVAGCGATLSGTGVPAEIDVRTLDTGRFPTAPPKFASRLDSVGYARLEAARLAGAVLSPHEVDAAVYSIGASAEIHTDAQTVTDFLADQTVPTLQKYGFLIGFSTGSADERVPLKKALYGTRKREGLTVTVLRFPDAAAANSAAAELDAVDSSLNPENVAVKLPKYPDAHAHWRPTVPTLGSTTPHGPYVISILADSRNTDVNHLVDVTQKYLDAEIPELDGYVATPPGKFDTLRQDPDGVLARLLQDNGVVPAPDGQGEVVYTLRGYLNYVQDQSSRFPVMSRAGVDRVAMSPTAFVFRARDDAAAAQFVKESAELGDAVDRRAVDPPDGIPNAACVQDYAAAKEAQFRCFVAYRRYAALELGGRLWETQQRAAAQYALLANSQG